MCSMVDKWGTCGGGGSPKMSWERPSPSKARKSGLYGKPGCCILRTNTDNDILRILTANKSAATTSRKKSPKSTKLDSEVIPVYPSVVVVKCARTERFETRRSETCGKIRKFEKLTVFIIFVKNHARCNLGLKTGVLKPPQYQWHPEPLGKQGFPGSFRWNSKEVARLM